MKSWKTTVAGVILIVNAIITVVSALIQDPPAVIDWNTVILNIIAGIGLIVAKDTQVTGGTIPQSSWK